MDFSLQPLSILQRQLATGDLDSESLRHATSHDKWTSHEDAAFYQLRDQINLLDRPTWDALAMGRITSNLSL